ncbi:FAD-dependent oxidoreductase [Streptomyces sp. NPDC056149]|uniref:FAD-dependent oxidoreductase n=1 Tax=Streptomyces sp. NPDC056149 TaxID=3345728 RepID=UPI0035D53D5C
MHRSEGKPPQVDEEFDVVVVGGGSAGVAAAVGAARAGCRTRLIEKYGFLGGAATAASVSIYCGFFDQRRRRVVDGVGGRVLRRLREAGGYQEGSFPWSGNTFVLLDVETTKAALDRETSAAGVDVRLHSTVVAARRQDGRVREIEVSDPAGRHRIAAGAFVDASGDGALCALAGAGVRVTPLAERQTSTLVCRYGGVVPGADLSREGVQAAVAAHNRCSPEPLPREKGVLARLPVTGEVLGLLVDEHVDALDAAALTGAEVSARRQARAYLDAFRTHLSGWEHACLLGTGPQLGIREGRRLHAREEVCGADALAARKRPRESIARCGWPVEVHSGQGATRFVPIEGKGWYDIPYGAICSADVDNLWAAGRLTGSDAEAFASLRVMGTAFATGHAAGVAAALYASGTRHVVPAVRAELLRQGACV